jgi:hypothetical protein
MHFIILLTSVNENAELNLYGTVLALLVSGLLFFDGYRSLQNGDKQGARIWQTLGLIVLLIYAGAAIYFRDWTLLILPILGLVLEIWLILRWRRSKTTTTSQ